MAEGGGSGWKKRREGGGGGSVAGGRGWHGRGGGGGRGGGRRWRAGREGRRDAEGGNGDGRGPREGRGAREAPSGLPAAPSPAAAAATNPAAMAAMTPEIAPLSEDYSGQTGGRAAGRASTGSGVSRRRRGFANREASLGCRFSAVKPKCAHLRGPASGTSGGRGDAVVARPGWRICCSGGIGFEAAEMARHNNMAVDLIIWIGVLGASISLDEYVD